jgi:diguanylate cyclase (GGDEF)-like protein
MAEFKDPAVISDIHIAFRVALEVEDPFDSRSATVSQKFGAWRPSAHSHAHQAAFDACLKMLATSGLLADVGQYCQVTAKGRTWAQVFQLRHDGTFVVFGSTVDALAWPIYKQALLDLENSLDDLAFEIQSHLGPEHTRPARITALSTAVQQLQSIPAFPGKDIPLQTYQEAAVLACRQEMLRLRARKEQLELRARDRHVLESALFKLVSLQSILDIADLTSARTAPKPRITDFVNVGIIEAKNGRATDEKFGILSAPTLFSTDFAEAAEGAFSRDRSFAVGFVDIDDFGSFNKAHSETVVDQDMLPYFMRALEAYCYARAHAYRQGGDEYLVLLRNAKQQEAAVFFNGLRAYIAEIDYPSTIKHKPTVSIGVHVIDGNNEVTVFEAKKLANDAKNVAKKANKNCIRFSTDPISDS